MTDNALHGFQQQSLTLIDTLLPLSGAIFFLIEPDMQHRGAVFYNLSPSIEQDYTRHFSQLDPLNPARFSDKALTVVTLDSQMQPHLLKQTRYYQQFMQPHNHRYVADMFFRQQGEITAVLSILRQQTLGPFLADELQLLQQLQPFMEYSLNTIYLPVRQQQRACIRADYQLTERELDVLERLLSGSSNKAIANELGLSLATVKTHLHHIFSKTGVSRRTELVSLIMRRLSI
ncbi:MAG: LuxR C-terminal-related transcriptional regulator [Marinobacterium sp.]|nr:LuxR C-terminal-related transcriptional regulator [Marinobacterium sp.]